MNETALPESFAKGKNEVLRVPVSASSMSGTIVRGYCYTRKADTAGASKCVPLLCLPSDTGNSREYHGLALAIQRQSGVTRTVLSLDMRGRGRSDHANIETYNPLIEAEDVISFCDAMGLHQVDVLATGGSAMCTLLIAPKRPGLIRSIIFNDGGPERDGVGIARAKAIYQQMPEPDNWDEAIDILKQAKGKNFPALTEKDWLEMAQSIYEEKEGALIRSHDKVFTGAESRIDFDERLPMFWTEFSMFKNKRVLVIRGENSLLITDALTQRMKNISPKLQEIVVEGQGHPPMLSGHGLPKKITEFLNRQES